MTDRILLTGSLGQIGMNLAIRLRELYGVNNVILSDLKEQHESPIAMQGPYYKLDVTNGEQLNNIVKKEKITVIYHLAALLSKTCEDLPELAWAVNLGGLRNVLEVSRQNKVQVFHPSTIGVFGKFYNQQYTVQDSVLRPVGIYGITKVTGELLCDYYYEKHGVDTRGVRYPGILSAEILGGGTTDYAVYMIQNAVKGKNYDCFLLPNTRLDMMYIDDAVNASIGLMQADPSRLLHRNAFNITALNFTPQEFAKSVQKFYPDFKITYENIDPIRQEFADSWPKRMADSCAVAEWGFSPKFNLDQTVEQLIKDLDELDRKKKLDLQQNNTQTQQQTQSQV